MNPVTAARLIEIVGPAGAGKSSLQSLLLQRSGGTAGNIAIPRTRYLRDIVGLLPTFTKLHRPFQRVRGKEMKRVLHLTTLERVLAANSPDVTVRVLDEGPVYMLARLLYFDEQRLKSDAFQHWWRGVTTRWARALHAIVWLDADAAILARRIRARAARPPISDTSDAALFPFLERYRRCYATVLHDLVRADGPVIVPVDTSVAAIEEVADRVSTAVTLCRR